MTRVQLVTVAEDEAEQRVDRWLKRHWPHLGQARVEKMCRKGELRVDGGRVKASTRIRPGMVVRVPPIPDAGPEEEAAQRNGGPDSPVVADADAQTLRDAVLMMDDDVIVLNKSPGLPVQGGSGQRRHLGMLLPALRFGRADDPRLVHRLDKDTSGLLVLARSGAAAASLSRAFRGRAVDKLYFAAVAGCPDPVAGSIRFGLVKKGSAGHEKMETVHPDAVRGIDGARAALTEYKVLEQAGNRMAWVALRPVTGRMHQLRAHMAALGTPIAGDGKYGGRGQENLGDGWSAGLGGDLSRKLHLHACRLRFLHPRTGDPVVMTAPLPAHMAQTWSMMGWRANVGDADLSDILNEPVRRDRRSSG